MKGEEIRKELAAARERLSTGGELDAREDIICGDVLLAERNLSESRGRWEIAALAEELMENVSVLEGYDHLLSRCYDALERMSECINERPRLKLRLLRLWLLVANRISCIQDHELSVCDDLVREISGIERNITYADAGELEKIECKGVLKSDPVEWTARWEEVIDEAEKTTEEQLSGAPRGMGFCFAYWSALENALSGFGVKWRNPHLMNPGVIFD